MSPLNLSDFVTINHSFFSIQSRLEFPSWSLNRKTSFPRFTVVAIMKGSPLTCDLRAGHGDLIAYFKRFCLLGACNVEGRTQMNRQHLFFVSKESQAHFRAESPFGNLVYFSLLNVPERVFIVLESNIVL